MTIFALRVSHLLAADDKDEHGIPRHVHDPRNEHPAVTAHRNRLAKRVFRAYKKHGHVRSDEFRSASRDAAEFNSKYPEYNPD